MPVMLAEALALLDPLPGQIAVDCTAGAGGHAEPILERITPDGILVAIDKDEAALNICRARLARRGGAKARFVLGDFKDLEEHLKAEGLIEADRILADLGVSSMHLDDPARGFAFMRDGPLDMRMSSRGPSAADLVAEMDEKSLEDIIRRYGEERAARRIARAIVREREKAPIDTTGKLRDTVLKALGLRPGSGYAGRRHPATKTFQALRIAVNDELGALERLLEVGPRLLRPGGRMAVLSYHSLEDRRVKMAFKALAAAGGYEWVGPLNPSEREIRENPRSRSARLRAIVRTM